MSDVAIKADDLSKLYKIGERQQYRMLREAFYAFLKKVYRPGLKKENSDFIWALKDVSFEIKQGEIVGIIGKNGAGKSTLLKILSRITPPTEGSAVLNGRVSSLLEIGIGFHPELTGRENIYLNGAILGMKKNEIKAKFDEIVDFAEIEKFIDTPIKYYSSGMYVRLAFAVAAHLNSEILLVDEVLAVGDIEFQKKCIGKMEKVAHEGNTILIVSHNMSNIKALCDKAILLEQGKIKIMGDVNTVINTYMSSYEPDKCKRIIMDDDYVSGEKQIKVKYVYLVNSALNRFSVYWLTPIDIMMEIEVYESINDVSFGVGIKTLDDIWVYFVHQDDNTGGRWHFNKGRYNISVRLKNNLKPGIYRLAIGAHHKHYLKNIFHIESIVLEILDYSPDGQIPKIYNPGITIGEAIWEEPERII